MSGLRARALAERAGHAPKSGAVLGLATFLPTLDQWGSIAVHVFSIERLVRSTPTERNFA
jgi:hypothetical protein